LLEQPVQTTPAYMAGVRAGDKLLAVDGVEIQGWGEARRVLLESLTTGSESRLTLQDTSERIREVNIYFSRVSGSLEGVDLMGRAGLMLQAPEPRVMNVIAGSAGEQAGIREGDIVLEAGSLEKVTIPEFIKLVQSSPGVELPLLVSRDSTEIMLYITPRQELDAQNNTIGKIGVAFSGAYPFVTIRYGFFESIYLATVQTFDTAWFSLKMLGKMVTGQLSWQNISGPIAIADYAGQSAELGIERFIEFIALITVSIGVLNLIPIPGLDGGQMLFCLIEMVRKKALSEQVQEKSLMIGYSILLFLMIFAFINDISRVL